MGAIVELLSDEYGIVWPKSVAPFDIHLVEISLSENVRKEAKKLYDILTKNGIAVLYDDRDARAGEKFADSDLIGIPARIVMSENTIKKASVELKMRNSKESKIKTVKEITDSDFLTSLIK